MHKTLFLFLLFSISTTFLKAQNEVELISIGYRSIEKAPLESKKYDALNDVNSSNDFYTLSLNYGHYLKDSTYTLSYSLNYEHIVQNVDLSKVNQDNQWNSIPENYYQQPQFSQLSFSLGLNKTLKKDWSLSAIFNTNIVDDFFKPELPTNINLSGMVFIAKKFNDNFTIGAGMLLVELERKLFTSPVISLKYQNEKRGIEAVIPAKLRMWQKINKKSYVEASVYNTFYSIEYQPNNEVISTDILSFKPELTYNYLWENFIKLSIGIDLPLRDVTVSAKKETFKYRQNSFGFNIGLSIVMGRD